VRFSQSLHGAHECYETGLHLLTSELPSGNELITGSGKDLSTCNMCGADGLLSQLAFTSLFSISTFVQY
jgi:hypothetical protein